MLYVPANGPDRYADQPGMRNFLPPGRYKFAVTISATNGGTAERMYDVLLDPEPSTRERRLTVNAADPNESAAFHLHLANAR